MAALSHALAEGPAVVVIEGEGGIGKSTLLREYLASSGADQRVLVGRCPPFRQPHTLGPVADAVRQATDRAASLPLSALCGALRPLFPEWADDLPPAPEPAEDPTAARHRLFRALAELVGCLRVSLLVLEDAQWADGATKVFGVELSMASFYEAPTLAAIAAAIDSAINALADDRRRPGQATAGPPPQAVAPSGIGRRDRSAYRVAAGRCRNG